MHSKVVLIAVCVATAFSSLFAQTQQRRARSPIRCRRCRRRSTTKESRQWWGGSSWKTSRQPSRG